MSQNIAQLADFLKQTDEHLDHNWPRNREEKQNMSVSKDRKERRKGRTKVINSKRVIPGAIEG